MKKRLQKKALKAIKIFLKTKMKMSRQYGHEQYNSLKMKNKGLDIEKISLNSGKTLHNTITICIWYPPKINLPKKFF